MLNPTRINGPDPGVKVTRISSLDDFHKIYEDIHLATPSQLNTYLDFAVSTLTRKDRDDEFIIEHMNLAIITLAEVLSTKHSSLTSRIRQIIRTWEEIAQTVLIIYNNNTDHGRAGKMLKGIIDIMYTLSESGGQAVGGTIWKCFCTDALL